VKRNHETVLNKRIFSSERLGAGCSPPDRRAGVGEVESEGRALVGLSAVHVALGLVGGRMSA